MFRIYPSLFPNDLVSLDVDVSKKSARTNQTSKLRRRAQAVIEKIKANQSWAFPAYSIERRLGLDYVTFD